MRCRVSSITGSYDDDDNRLFGVAYVMIERMPKENLPVVVMGDDDENGIAGIHRNPCKYSANIVENISRS